MRPAETNVLLSGLSKAKLVEAELIGRQKDDNAMLAVVAPVPTRQPKVPLRPGLY